jgi:hypothetical protein
MDAGKITMAMDKGLVVNADVKASMVKVIKRITDELTFLEMVIHIPTFPYMWYHYSWVFYCTCLHCGILE